MVISSLLLSLLLLLASARAIEVVDHPTSTEPACNAGWPPVVVSPNLTLALYQARVVVGNRTANIEKLDQAAALAAEHGAQLVATPELFTTGYSNFSAAELVELSETRDGQSHQAVAAIADKYNISVVFGYLERDPATGHLFDSAQLVDSSGQTLINYRKVHPNGVENLVFTAGSEIGPVVELNGVRVGLQICADVSMPESSRVLALLGADIIITPTAQGAPPEFNGYSNFTIPQRANENVAFVAYINFVQDGSFHGLSRLADPVFCSMLAGSTDTEQLLITTVNPGTWRPFRASMFGERHPSCYREICDCNPASSGGASSTAESSTSAAAALSKVAAVAIQAVVACLF